VKKIISKILYISLIVTLGLLSSCSGDNDILATSRIKNITRKEFYNWLDAKKAKKESILDSKNKQKKMLESMAIEFFIMDKAKVEGFEKNRKLIVLKDRERESTLLKYYFSTLRSKATYNEPVIRVSYILLNVNWYIPDPNNKNKKIRLEGEEIDKQFDQLMLKAEGLIKRLDAGESFEKLATEFSEDSTKKRGGDFGFILKDMMPDYFSTPAFKLKDGEYTKTPVKTPKGIYIIKVTAKASLTEKNIDKIIEDKKQREKFKIRLSRRYTTDYITGLKNAADVKFFYKKGETYNSTDVLFQIGTKEYTLSNIEKTIEKRATQDELEKLYVNGVLPDKIKYNFMEQYFMYLLLTRDAEILGVVKKPEYIKELKEKEINLVVAEYLDERISKTINVSDQQIRDVYEKVKEDKYPGKVMENGVLVSQPIPFDEVKDEIRDEIVKKQTYQKGQEWEKKVLKEYDLKINEMELEGN
jgi:foldase protein PrsA